MECKRDSFIGALGGARETHCEYVLHRLNSANPTWVTRYLYFRILIMHLLLNERGSLYFSSLSFWVLCNKFVQNIRVSTWLLYHQFFSVVHFKSRYTSGRVLRLFHRTKYTGVSIQCLESAQFSDEGPEKRGGRRCSRLKYVVSCSGLFWKLISRFFL